MKCAYTLWYIYLFFSVLPHVFSSFNSFVTNLPRKIMEAFKQAWTLIKDNLNCIVPKKQYILEHYTMDRKEKEGQKKKINIPVFPTPKYKYEHLWKSKFTSQYLKAPHTKNPHDRVFPAVETFTPSKNLATTTEETGSLLNVLKIGKYRLKIFYKLSFDK